MTLCAPIVKNSPHPNCYQPPERLRYNYGRYVGEAIESALAQTYAPTEVFVVDDGSTDDSQQVISRYVDRVRIVFKRNGGQASVFNAGFAMSRGDIIIFLDSDDTLLPEAVANALPLFAENVAKVHWPLWEIDGNSVRMNKVVPQPPLSEGDLRPSILRAGADGYIWSPTSGNAWSRRFLEQVLPMPEPEFVTCPDYYLSTLVPLYGTMLRLSQPYGCKRTHGKNQRWFQPLGKCIQETIDRVDYCFGILRQHCEALGLGMNVEEYRANSWFQWLQQQSLASQEIEARVPTGHQFILVDDATWEPCEVIVTGRRAIPFLEKNGIYWGPPPDNETAMRELERLRRQGASFIAFAWPAFWWLDFFAGFHRYLRSKYRCVLENDRIILFELRATDSIAVHHSEHREWGI
jgi:hypothetical protein